MLHSGAHTRRGKSGSEAQWLSHFLLYFNGHVSHSVCSARRVLVLIEVFRSLVSGVLWGFSRGWYLWD